VPGELKDSVEKHLFQQYCSYIEPIGYTDLLLNIMRMTRARWYATSSSTASGNPGYPLHAGKSQQQLMDEYDMIRQNRGSPSDQSQQSLNIQFRRYISKS
jgi:hypothetical protein